MSTRRPTDGICVATWASTNASARTMKISPPNMWYRKSTRLMCDHGRYWVTNPIRITVAGKLRWRTMKYGRARTHGRLVHQIHGLPRASMREMGACPGQWWMARFVYSAWERTGPGRNRPDHPGGP